MSTFISAELRAQVRERDNNRCVYCQTPEELTVTTFEVDHIVPTSAGGETVLDNLCLACPACNRYKSNRQSGPDPETGQVVSIYHPRQQEWSDHFAWNEDQSQIIGLTPTGRATIEILRMNRSQMARLRGLWIKMGYSLTAN
jgi:hypothetical protein